MGRGAHTQPCPYLPACLQYRAPPPWHGGDDANALCAAGRGMAAPNPASCQRPSITRFPVAQATTTCAPPRQGHCPRRSDPGAPPWSVHLRQMHAPQHLPHLPCMAPPPPPPPPPHLLASPKAIRRAAIRPGRRQPLATAWPRAAQRSWSCQPPPTATTAARPTVRTTPTIHPSIHSASLLGR